jgi:hypothetical protein
MLVAATVYETGLADSPKSTPSSRIVLEVVNRHFTVGEKIPSLYLRVLSDGTAECHAIKYWDETDVKKMKTLPAEDFAKLMALIDEPGLLKVRSRYKLMDWVFDSWMEWEIKIQHPGNVQKIEVASFSPASAQAWNTPYPDALVKLGCLIEKVRNDVYADSPRDFDSDECKKALATEP